MPGSHEDPAVISHADDTDKTLASATTSDPNDPSSQVTHAHSVRLGLPEQQLVGRMDDLAGLLRQLGEVKDDQKKTWWWLKGGAGFLIFDVAISILGAIAIYLGNGVIDQVQAQQHNVCTLYSFVINSYNPAARERSPLGPVQYDNFYRQLQHAADGTQCGIPHKIT